MHWVFLSTLQYTYELKLCFACQQIIENWLFLQVVLHFFVIDKADWCSGTNFVSDDDYKDCCPLRSCSWSSPVFMQWPLRGHILCSNVTRISTQVVWIVTGENWVFVNWLIFPSMRTQSYTLPSCYLFSKLVNICWLIPEDDHIIWSESFLGDFAH